MTSSSPGEPQCHMNIFNQKDFKKEKKGYTRPHNNEVNDQHRNLGNKLPGGWNLQHLNYSYRRKTQKP